MIRLLALAVLLAAGCPFLISQPFQREISSVPVTVKGRSIELPFAGGINSPVYRFVDIDNDLDLDLFLFDNDLRTDFYRNTGSPALARFELEPSAIRIPRISIWFAFVDLNGDGLTDLLTDTAGTSISYYRNIGPLASPQFVLEEGILRDTGGIPLFAGNNSLPAFIDIDADGDADFFSTNALNGSFNFYRNTGTRFEPEFIFVTDFYEGITVVGDSCMQGVSRSLSSLSSPLHGASAIGFADLDGNGTQDLYLGDLFSRIVFEFRNGGTPSVPSLGCFSNRFPDEYPILSSGFNVCSFHDIDGDRDLDMFVSILAGIVERNGFWFLENTGDSNQHAFVLRSKEFLSVLDVGQSAHPALADLDADGDPDMLCGTSDGLIWFFRNDGTPAVPRFVCDDTLYAGIGGGYTAAPALGDIDADGDQDMFLGGFNGRIGFYRNTGSPVSPQFVGEAFPTDTITVFQYSSPAFADIDGDRDLDLFIGGYEGTIAFYRNEGDSTRFIPVHITTAYESISVPGRAAPEFVDFDDDGDIDIVVGAADGSLRYYRNDGTPGIASYVLADDRFAGSDPSADAVPAMGDLDADGDADLLIGTKKGGLHLYRNNRIAGDAGGPGEPAAHILGRNYPNPFNPSTTIRYHITEGDIVRIAVFDIFGRQIEDRVEGWRSVGDHEALFNGAHLSSGIYFYRISSGSGSVFGNMILTK